MLSYSNIQSLVDAGQTASQIATTLKSTGVTNKPINRADLVHLLNMRGMLTKLISNNADEKWTGTVLSMQTAIAVSGDAVANAAITQWLSHITNPTNTIWDTTQTVFAAPFWAMVQAFANQAGMPTTADFEAVAALGGGWKYASVTAEQVQSLIDLKPKEDALVAVQAKANAANAAAEAEFRAEGSTVETITAAANTAWSA